MGISTFPLCLSSNELDLAKLLLPLLRSSDLTTQSPTGSYNSDYTMLHISFPAGFQAVVLHISSPAIPKYPFFSDVVVGLVSLNSTPLPLSAQVPLGFRDHGRPLHEKEVYIPVIEERFRSLPAPRHRSERD
ncbi:hypothetical protein KSP39_PZI004233 [Platanthera zijinensis]|uniref:Uncharacterized protein n=1 Tax=Platanthera zijinensis TaxID=2320716 RepID=A0AAP0BU48_9ASPA